MNKNNKEKLKELLEANLKLINEIKCLVAEKKKLKFWELSKKKEITSRIQKKKKQLTEALNG